MFCSVGRAYAQHGRSEGSGSHCVWYHPYLSPESHNLADAIAFACRDIIDAGSRGDETFVKKVDGSGEADGDVESSENESSRNEDEKKSELSNSSLDRRSTTEEE